MDEYGCECMALIKTMRAQITVCEQAAEQPWPAWITHWVDEGNARIVLLEVEHEQLHRRTVTR